VSALPVIPRPAATLIPVRDGPNGVEAFMLRRSHLANFAANAYVFPGGTVDAADAGAEAIALCNGLDEDAANRELDLAAGALAYRICAVRECFEEAGLLFACDRNGEPVALDAPVAHEDYLQLRRRLNARELSFVELCRERGLRLALGQLAYFGHWITPLGMPRRYDTRFFIGVAPPDQTPLHDGEETVQHLWVEPAIALARHRAGDFPLLFATATNLELLSSFANCEALMAHARAAGKTGPHLPRRARGKSGSRVLGQDDPAYAEVGKLDPEGLGAASSEIVPGTVTVLAPALRRLTAPNPGMMTGPGTNSYLLGHGGDLAVIDPGPAIQTHVKALLDLAASLNGRIRWILTTHTHLDHSPAAQLLKQATGAELIGMPPPPFERQDPTFKPERVPAHGERIELTGCALRAIHTPGHASNHLCYLLEQEKLLFTGDHVMQGSTVVINPPDGEMRAYLASLRALLEEDLAYLAPGHGFLIGQPHAEIERLLRHRAGRENKIAEALRRVGPATLDALLPVAYSDVPARLYPPASRSLLAHLIKLEAEGSASRDQHEPARWRMN
jgi:glyoxylase-like metal-dependent hydrolase (beta-lactamase superfamily II)/8-oxo-dGTP pyrophosphatase MutT (NUDIX family)